MDGIGKPQISVVITSKDRAPRLDQTLRSLAAARPANIAWELLVVDNGSRDDTAAIIRRHSTALPIRYLAEPQPGINRARNRALDLARAELLVFTDDDVRVDRGWLEEIRNGAARWPDDAVFGGRIVPRLPATTPAWMTSQAFFFKGYAFSDYHPASEEGPVHMAPFGPNFAIRRSLFRQRGFDPSIGPNGLSYPMGAETEFLLWARRTGHRFIYLPRAVVHHVITPPQIRERHLLQRAFNAGRGWEMLDLDREFSGASSATSARKLKRDLRRCRRRRLTRVLSNREHRFRNKVKMRMIQGRLYQRRLDGC